MDAKIEDLQKNLDKNLIFSSVYSDPFGRLANILSRFWELISAIFHLFDHNAASQLVWLVQKVICFHSTWLLEEKKLSDHICDAIYAVREPRKPVAHLLLPEKSFRLKRWSRFGWRHISLRQGSFEGWLEGQNRRKKEEGIPFMPAAKIKGYLKIFETNIVHPGVLVPFMTRIPRQVSTTLFFHFLSLSLLTLDRFEASAKWR